MRILLRVKILLSLLASAACRGAGLAAVEHAQHNAVAWIVVDKAYYYFVADLGSEKGAAAVTGVEACHAYPRTICIVIYNGDLYKDAVVAIGVGKQGVVQCRSASHG